MTQQEAVQSFSSKIAKKEGAKKSISIGNVREVLKAINEELGANNWFYMQILKHEETHQPLEGKSVSLVPDEDEDEAEAEKVEE